MNGVRVRERTDGVLLDVRVSPGARREGVLGVHDGCLKLAVTVAPEKGKANQAVLRLLARSLGCRLSDLEIQAGAAARTKTVLIRELDASILRDRIRALLTPLEERR